MKKIIIVFLLIFTFCFDVSAKTSFTLGERIPDTFVTLFKNSQQHLNMMYVLKREDGNFVYCIDPYMEINLEEGYEEYAYNNNLFNLSAEKLNKINLFAYYGYGYENHSGLNWYAATQYLIWNEFADDSFFSTNKGIKISKNEEEINELNTLVNDYYKLPSFANGNYNFTIDTEYEIMDYNYVLNNYKVKNSNIDYRIIDNKLYIETSVDGNYEINFVKESPVSRDYLLYGLNGSQSLIYPGRINDIEFKINIEVASGSITINKVDSEGKERSFANLKGAIYGIYKDNELVNNLVTDENGYAYINTLKLGKYTVKELSPSEGYNLDNNIYEVELTYDDRDIVIESSESIIKGDIILNKYYGEDIKENGAIFEIYDINKNFINSYETIDGTVKDTLEYGDYYIIQTKGIDGYELIEPFNLSIKENKEYIFDLYDNKIIEEIQDFKDDVLIVEVPDTGVQYKYNIYPLILIGLGILMIFSTIMKSFFSKNTYNGN